MNIIKTQREVSANKGKKKNHCSALMSSNPAALCSKNNIILCSYILLHRLCKHSPVLHEHMQVQTLPDGEAIFHLRWTGTNYSSG